MLILFMILKNNMNWKRVVFITIITLYGFGFGAVFGKETLSKNELQELEKTIENKLKDGTITYKQLEKQLKDLDFQSLNLPRLDLPFAESSESSSVIKFLEDNNLKKSNQKLSKEDIKNIRDIIRKLTVKIPPNIDNIVQEKLRNITEKLDSEVKETRIQRI